MKSHWIFVSLGILASATLVAALTGRSGGVSPTPPAPPPPSSQALPNSNVQYRTGTTYQSSTSSSTYTPSYQSGYQGAYQGGTNYTGPQSAPSYQPGTFQNTPGYQNPNNTDYRRPSQPYRGYLSDSTDTIEMQTNTRIYPENTPRYSSDIPSSYSQTPSYVQEQGSQTFSNPSYPQNQPQSGSYNLPTQQSYSPYQAYPNPGTIPNTSESTYQPSSNYYRYNR